MGEKSKILIIGGTGYIGKHIVEASAKAGHPTFALVRESTTLSDPNKANLLNNFKILGVNLVLGDLYDHESLVKVIKQVDVVISTVGHALFADQVKIIAAIKEAGNVKGDLFDHESLVKVIKQVDVVISTVGHELLGDQVNIIAAIKEAGNVKRFLPSEFGNDSDKVHPIEPAKSDFEIKVQIRRAIEAEGIPYTYVACNCFAGYFLPTLAQPEATSPPRDKVIILGDGNAKALFNKEEDIGTFTIRAVDDPRTLNKVLYINAPKNIYSFNEIVALWEKKIGKTLEKIYVPEDKILKDIEEASYPDNVELAINHMVFVKGDHFETDPSSGVNACGLYPDVKYTTVDEYLDQFV